MKISFESKGNFDVINGWLKHIIKIDPSVVANQIASEGKRSLSANTPIDTGETASGWVSEVKSNGTTTEIAWKNVAHPGAGVNIAKIIDQGHGTGTGGYIPPKPYIKKAMTPVWGSADNMINKELIK
jgi:hypothetical protein